MAHGNTTGHNARENKSARAASIRGHLRVDPFDDTMHVEWVTAGHGFVGPHHVSSPASLEVRAVNTKSENLNRPALAPHDGAIVAWHLAVRAAPVERQPAYAARVVFGIRRPRPGGHRVPLLYLHFHPDNSTPGGRCTILPE